MLATLNDKQELVITLTDSSDDGINGEDKNGQQINLTYDQIQNAKVIIDDLRGDGDHYAAQIIAEEFRGKTRVQQHQWSTMQWVVEWEKNYMR